MLKSANRHLLTSLGLLVAFTLFGLVPLAQAESLFVSGGGGGGGGMLDPDNPNTLLPALGGAHAGSGGPFLGGRVSGGGGAYVGDGTTAAQDGQPTAGGKGFGPGAENGQADGKGGDAFAWLTRPASYGFVTIQGGQGGFIADILDLTGLAPNTGGKAVLTATAPLWVSEDFHLKGGEGNYAAMQEEQVGRYYQLALDHFNTTGTRLEHSGRAEFSGTNLSIGKNLVLQGGQGGTGVTNMRGQYATNIAGGSARMSVANLAVGGNVSLGGGSTGELVGGNGGDARLLVQNNLLVQGDFAISAGHGGNLDLQDVLRYESFLFGSLNGGPALATARQAEIYGKLSLQGGGNNSQSGAVAEERASEFLYQIIERLENNQYGLLGYETYEDFVPVYGDLDSLIASGLLGLTGFTAAPAFFSAQTLAVHGTVRLQGGVGLSPFSALNGRYAVGAANNGGAAIILARDLSVGNDLRVLGGERITPSDTPGDARVLVENRLFVGNDLILQSASAMSYTYDYEQGESRSAQIQILYDVVRFETFIFGAADTGGVAYVQAGEVEIGGNLSISGNMGALNKVAEERSNEYYSLLRERGIESASILASTGARAELRANQVRVNGDVSLQGGNGGYNSFAENGRYTGPADGGAALLYAVSLETNGRLLLSGGDYVSSEFSSRPGQALLILEQDLYAAGGARLQGGNGGTTLTMQLDASGYPATADSVASLERTARAEITARDISLGNSLEIIGGQGHNTSLQSRYADYANILSAGRAQVTARNIVVRGDLVIQGGLGGDSGSATSVGYGQIGIGGTRGGKAGLDASGTVSLYGNAYLSDGTRGVDAELPGGLGGAAQLTAQTLAFKGSGHRVFELTRHQETLVNLQRLALDSNLNLGLSLDNTLAEQSNLGTLAFNANSQLIVTSTNNGQFSYSGLEVSGLGSRFEAAGAALDNGQTQSAAFILSGRLNSASTPMLTVSGHDLTLDAAALVGDTLFRGLAQGDSLALLTLENGSLQDAGGLDGLRLVSSLGDVFELRLVNDTLYALLAEFVSIDAFKPLAQSRLAGTVQLSRATDLLLGNGWQAFERELATQAEPGRVSFAATSLYRGQAKTGSHLDANGLNLVLGLGRRFAGPAGQLDAAVFLETGFGNYQTYANYANIMDINGDGTSSYLGAGLLARFGLESGLYLEASARAGRLDTEFTAANLGLDGGPATYNAHNWYVGGHTGLGYQTRLSPNLDLDLAGRLIWTHQNPVTLRLEQDEFEQQAIDSLRARLSARLNHALTEKTSAYYGLGAEYEFGARANSSYLGTPIAAPDLTGFSYFAELGLGLQLSAATLVDLGLFASLGRYQGVGGNLRISFKF